MLDVMYACGVWMRWDEMRWKKIFLVIRKQEEKWVEAIVKEVCLYERIRR